MQNLPREQRLRNRRRIGELFADGSWAKSGAIGARALPNDGGPTRLVAIAAKSMGGAVVRNRLKRRIRAAFRLQNDDLPRGWDFAVLARRGLLEARWQDVMRDVRVATEKAAGQACGHRRSRPSH